MSDCVKKPKFLVKEKWGVTQERATNTGEWPFQFQEWKMTFYPYTHDTDEDLIWLEPDIEHIHLFVQQSVKMQGKVPIYNPKTFRFDTEREMPFCQMCGLFMPDHVWDHFMDCKEMVRLSVEK